MTVTDNSGCVAVSNTNIVGPTSVAVLEEVVVLKVFPNPSKDVLNVELHLSKAQDLDLEILNQLGQKVWAKHFAAFHQGIEPVDVSKLASGVYILRVNANHHLKTVRLVKE